MRKLAFALSLALISCASPAKREPAQTPEVPPPPPSLCEMHFRATLGHPLRLNPKYAAREAMIFPQAKFLAEQTVPALQNRFDKIRRLPQGCEKTAELNQIYSEIVPRLYAARVVKSQIRIAGEKRDVIQTHAMFNDPGFAARVSCRAACPTDDGKNCAKCGFDEESDYAALRLFGLSIKDCEGDAADYQTQFSKYTALIKPYVYAGVRPLQAGSPAIENALEGLIDLEAKVSRANKPVKGCPAHRQDETAANLARSVSKVGGGSGFFIKSEGETYVVTAEHVNTSDAQFADLTINRKAEVRSAKSFAEFSPTPGLYSFGGDIMMAKKEWDGPTLEVAALNALPKLGQKFRVTGYPAATKNEFRAYECTFEGIFHGARPGANDPNYVLQCAKVETTATGQSGGALVGEDGKAWGVISGEIMLTGHILASPIGSEGGKVKIGFSKPMQTDLCMSLNDWSKTRKCTVMPQQYEENVP